MVDARPAAAVSLGNVRPPGAELAPSPTPGASTSLGGVDAPRRTWQWPLNGQPAVITPFRVGPARWSPGHRGVDLGGNAHDPVLAAGQGVVTFRGVIAGRPVVVVSHPSGIRTTYEPVTGSVPVGTAVNGGDLIGRLQVAGGHCAPQACLHWGALRGRTYLDPLSLLRLRPAILLPWSSG